MTADPSHPQVAADFDAPPIVEVALSVAFQPLELGVVQLADLWTSRYRDRFPHVEEQPPYQMPIEPAEGPMAGNLFSFQLAAAPLVPRLWFLDESQRHLLQVQRDWFAVNWRKLGGDAAYPRFSLMRADFEDGLQRYASFANEQGVGPIRPTQVEITYINHIPLQSRSAESALSVADALSVVRPIPIVGLPTPESYRVAFDYLMTNGAKAQGRLHVAANPAIRKVDQSQIIELTITARGKPPGDSLEDVFTFLEVGHDWAHRAFEGLTTDTMHRLWGRR